MNPLGKKAFLASCAGHVLLLTFLLISPAFMQAEKEKEVIDLPVIEYVPDRLIDEALYVPPPAEPAPVDEPPTVIPEPVVVEPEPEPKPEVKPPEPKPVPKEESKPKEPGSPKWEPNRNVQVSGARREVRPQPPKVQTTPRDTELERELEKTLKSVKNRSTLVEVDFASTDVSYASYAQEVARRYRAALSALAGRGVPTGVVKIQVVILKNGTVKSARIVAPSGQSSLDSNVRQVLDQVKMIVPFPPGAKDDERSYTIKLTLEEN